MPKNIFAILIVTLLGMKALAQEVLTIPTYNPAVAKQYLLKKSASFPAATESLTLPFYDDFSVISVYPSPARWADSNALVNTDYAKFPPTIGVATLDAIDKTGKLYANAGQFPFNADKLTSLPIRLDSIFAPAIKALTASDSIYLSFYYQPQGRGLMPSTKDSLILEFHSPTEFDTIVTASGTSIEPVWRGIWSSAGGVPVDTFAVSEKQYFRQVLIPILDSRYFKNGFQFRFRNIASLANSFVPDWQSNGDQWNIDAVWLNTGRFLHDTIIKDVAFAGNAPSMLRTYQSMPFDQYRKEWLNEIKDSLEIDIASLDNVPRNISYIYTMRKNSLEPFATYDGGNYNIFPYLATGYSTYKPFARPPVVSPFPPGTDEKVVFHIIHSITSDTDPLYQTNDTISFDQVFSNYYAYDNGTAEAGIGINGAAGSYAIKFELNIADTLRGMQIYFNQVKTATNQNMIDLLVWNDALGKPGQVIKTLNDVIPLYTNGVNELGTYWFETPLSVDETTFPSLIFYIGWTQSSIDNLNVGLDRYTDSHDKRFYNVDGTWQMSSPMNYGSLMFRPVIGLANPVGISHVTENQQILIQPNPVSDGKLFIGLPEAWKDIQDQNFAISIFSATGSRVLSSIFSPQLDVSKLAPGFYFVVLTDETSGNKVIGKLVVR